MFAVESVGYDEILGLAGLIAASVTVGDAAAEYSSICLVG